MRWLTSLEDRLHWIAFPGLFKYLTFLGVIIFAWQWVDPGVAERIAFDRGKILSGEVWRILSFAFAPTGINAFSPIGVFFLFIAVWIAFLISDSVESVWGPTRTTLYILATWLGLVVFQFIFDVGQLPSGGMIYTAMFFVFATYFPNYEFLLMFILPVKVRYFAWFSLAMLVFSVIGNPLMLVVVIPTLIPYALWVMPAVIKGQATMASAAKRRRKFNLASQPTTEAFHECATCHRTEKDDDDLEFRVMPDGTEYCIDHLPVPDKLGEDSEPKPS